MLDILEKAKSYLSDNGIVSAQAEAEWLLCDILNCSRADLFTRAIQIRPDESESLNNALSQRTSGRPLQYILGKAYFYGYAFKVTEDVLIPRPETEILVESVLSCIDYEPRARLTDEVAVGQASSYKLKASILDLCTGSGNIAIVLTKSLTGYKIYASDISKKAVNIAKENAEAHKVLKDIEFREGDLFAPWQDKKGVFDIIVSNPPYLNKADKNLLPQDVLEEPEIALFGKHSSISFYEQFADEAPGYLSEGGRVLLEISPDVSQRAALLLNKNFRGIKIIKDLNQRDRVIVASRR